MCDFRPGDEVVCIKGASGTFPTIGYLELIEGQAYTIEAVWLPGEIGETGLPVEHPTIQLVELGRCVEPTLGVAGFHADRFRKVQRKNTDLSIEAFSVIKPGFEEPKRTPAPVRKREDA